MSPDRTQVALLLDFLDEAFDRKSWHGTNLRGSLRRVRAVEAALRPGADRHNIWEIVLHTAYWKYTVRRRICREKRGTFPLAGSDWFERPVILTEEAWRQDIRFLEEQHRLLKNAVAGLVDAQLVTRIGRTDLTAARLVRGIAAHDLYHAGQIQLLKRLVKSAGASD